MQFKNLALGTVLTAPSPATSGTSLVLNSGEGARFSDPATTGEFYATAFPAGENPHSENSEIVKVTAISTDTFTIVRAQRSTTAKSIAVDWIVIQGIYAEDVEASQLMGIERQAIMNGNFDVSQRNTSFVAGANNDDVYTLDRWNLISDGNDVLDISQEAITDLPGSNYAIKLDVETSAQAGIVQFIEAKDAQKFKGKTVSISFAVKSANISAIRAAVLSWSSTADAVTSDVVGTWAATPTWATNWTAENTPADLTVTSSWTTVRIDGIAVDSATVNNLALAIWLPNAETIGDIIYISQVQMNAGNVALPFQPKSFGEELMACQRYYEKSFNYETAPADNAEPGSVLRRTSYARTVGSNIYCGIYFKVKKRTAPSVTPYSPGGAFGTTAGQWAWIYTGGFASGTSTTAIEISQQGFLIILSGSGLSNGDSPQICGHWGADAEL